MIKGDSSALSACEQTVLSLIPGNLSHSSIKPQRIQPHCPKKNISQSFDLY